MPGSLSMIEARIRALEERLGGIVVPRPGAYVRTSTAKLVALAAEPEFDLVNYTYQVYREGGRTYRDTPGNVLSNASFDVPIHDPAWDTGTPPVTIRVGPTDSQGKSSFIRKVPKDYDGETAVGDPLVPADNVPDYLWITGTPPVATVSTSNPLPSYNLYEDGMELSEKFPPSLKMAWEETYHRCYALPARTGFSPLQHLLDPVTSAPYFSLWEIGPAWKAVIDGYPTGKYLYLTINGTTVPMVLTSSGKYRGGMYLGDLVEYEYLGTTHNTRKYIVFIEVDPYMERTFTSGTPSGPYIERPRTRMAVTIYRHELINATQYAYVNRGTAYHWPVQPYQPSLLTYLVDSGETLGLATFSASIAYNSLSDNYWYYDGFVPITLSGGAVTYPDSTNYAPPYSTLAATGRQIRTPRGTVSTNPYGIAVLRITGAKVCPAQYSADGRTAVVNRTVVVDGSFDVYLMPTFSYFRGANSIPERAVVAYMRYAPSTAVGYVGKNMPISATNMSQAIGSTYQAPWTYTYFSGVWDNPAYPLSVGKLMWTNLAANWLPVYQPTGVLPAGQFYET